MEFESHLTEFSDVKRKRLQEAIIEATTYRLKQKFSQHSKTWDSENKDPVSNSKLTATNSDHPHPQEQEKVKGKTSENEKNHPIFKVSRLEKRASVPENDSERKVFQPYKLLNEEFEKTKNQFSASKLKSPTKKMGLKKLNSALAKTQDILPTHHIRTGDIHSIPGVDAEEIYKVQCYINYLTETLSILRKKKMTTSGRKEGIYRKIGQLIRNCYKINDTELKSLIRNKIGSYVQVIYKMLLEVNDTLSEDYNVLLPETSRFLGYLKRKTGQFIMSHNHDSAERASQVTSSYSRDLVFQKPENQQIERSARIDVLLCKFSISESLTTNKPSISGDMINIEEDKKPEKEPTAKDSSREPALTISILESSKVSDIGEFKTREISKVIKGYGRSDVDSVEVVQPIQLPKPVLQTQQRIPVQPTRPQKLIQPIQSQQAFQPTQPPKPVLPTMSPKIPLPVQSPRPVQPVQSSKPVQGSTPQKSPQPKPAISTQPIIPPKPPQPTPSPKPTLPAQTIQLPKALQPTQQLQQSHQITLQASTPMQNIKLEEPSANAPDMPKLVSSKLRTRISKKVYEILTEEKSFDKSEARQATIDFEARIYKQFKLETQYVDEAKKWCALMRKGKVDLNGFRTGRCSAVEAPNFEAVNQSLKFINEPYLYHQQQPLQTASSKSQMIREL